MRHENTFVREIKEKNITDSSDILNWYRNLYHTEDNHTERGIVAYAINDLFNEIKRLQVQNNDLDILVKDLRFRNKEFQKANEGLAKNIDELEIQIEEMIEFRINQVKRIFEEIEKALVFTEDRKRVAELKKKYIPECPDCKHFVGCECFSGMTCDDFKETNT